MQTIERLARSTAAEIDHIVHSLRDQFASTERISDHVEPPPGLAALLSLLAQHEAAGMPVALETRGAARALNPGVDQAAYRILQEALTNSARHGDGAASMSLS